MHFFIFHVLIGSAIAYFMQAHIKWVAERVTPFVPLQVVIKILLDALLAVGWIVVAPAILVARYQWLKEQEENDDGSDES